MKRMPAAAAVRARGRRAAGFSLVELAVAAALALLVAGAMLSLVGSFEAGFASQTEASDMRQRARVAVETLGTALAAAGAPPYAASDADRIASSSPPIAPFRAGADPPGIYRADTITIATVSRAGIPQSTTYWLKSDDVSAAYQLMVWDGVNADVPVVDHVVGLRFDYFGDPQPPLMRRPLADAVGPWTTYGARPALTGAGPFPPGENCLFVNDGTPVPAPRLAALGAPGDPLVPLASARLIDGPWCPDPGSPARWDADLLRIRRVVVTVRVEAARPSLRGPAGPLFTHGGTSRGGAAWLPDFTLQAVVAPPNLAVGR